MKRLDIDNIHNVRDSKVKIIGEAKGLVTRNMLTWSHQLSTFSRLLFTSTNFVSFLHPTEQIPKQRGAKKMYIYDVSVIYNETQALQNS